VPNYSAKFCGIIRPNPELAAGERGKVPHLRKDDGFRICLQAIPPAGSDSGRRGMNKPITDSAWKDLEAPAALAKFVFT